MKQRFLTIILLWSAACVMQAQSDQAGAGPKNGVILIIRHGEKTEPPDKKDHGLAAPGQARALAYVKYFSTQSVPGLALKPDALVATAESKSSNRPYLTIKPLADSLGQKILNRFVDDDVTGLAGELRSGRYDSKTTLVCWHHGKIPELLAGLGANSPALLGPAGWPGDEFGWLVILRFQGDGRLASSVVVNEKLMPDDTKEPPKP